jgi:hypothetical protein
MKQPISWNLADPWNEAAMSESRPLLPRDYLFASEIFGSKIDTYLKMLSIQPTNPPNDRSNRKFFAGHVWEFIVKQVLLCCGIYQQEEIKIDATPYPNLLSVHGRLDFVAGGYVDRDEAFAKIKEHHLPETLHGIANRAINKWHGMNLEKVILEIKSVALFTYDYIEKRRKPLDGHVGQTYHYERNNKEGYKGYIAYVSKDTTLLSQFGLPKTDIEAAYKQYIAKMTYYYTRREQPPLEPLMGFDDSVGNFSKNLKVEYSNYLSMLYGYSSPDDYRRNIQPTILRWNNVLGRYAKVEGGALTPMGKLVKISPENKEVRAEIIKSGYSFDELVQIKIQRTKEGIEITE